MGKNRWRACVTDNRCKAIDVSMETIKQKIENGKTAFCANKTSCEKARSHASNYGNWHIEHTGMNTFCEFDFD